MQYLNVYRGRRGLCVREHDGKKEIRRKVSFKPSLYTRCSDGSADFMDFYGGPVQKITFESMYEMKNHVKNYGDMPGELWGNTNPIYQYIYETYKDEPNPNNVNIAFLDIEVLSKQLINGEWVDGGFPVASEAKFPVNAICQYNSNKKRFVVYTTALWNASESILKYKDLVDYVYCKSEEELIEKWINAWEADIPAILTGWNVLSFDVTYMINRIKIVLGEDETKRLSPWGIIDSRETKNNFGQSEITYSIAGVAILDYIDLYKKYRYKPREKYTLSFIAKCELKEDEYKLEYEGSLNNLYYDNPTYFVDYNINDVFLITKFEETLQFVQIAVFLAYFAGINIEDSFSPIRIWDTLIYRECENRGIAIPMDKMSEAVEYEGAYVMDPIPGLKKCVVSFDLTSLYPSIMRQWAIGKDKHISGSAHMDLMNGLIEVLQNEQNSNASRQILTDIQQKGGFGEYYIENDIPACMTEYLEKNKVTMTVNNQFFSIEGESVFAYLINKLFKERKENKKMSQDFKKQAKEIDEELTRRGYVDKK